MNVNGTRIFTHRLNAGWSMQQLATAATTTDVNVSKATVYRAETGHRIEPGKLHAIAAALTHRLGQTITATDLRTKDQP